jgi:hypothetical protein
MYSIDSGANASANERSEGMVVSLGRLSSVIVTKGRLFVKLAGARSVAMERFNQFEPVQAGLSLHHLTGAAVHNSHLGGGLLAEELLDGALGLVQALVRPVSLPGLIRPGPDLNQVRFKEQICENWRGHLAASRFLLIVI